jgi:hypothetical protein
MKRFRWLLFLCLCLAVGCGGNPSPAPTSQPAPSHTPSQPGVSTTRVPDARAIARAYLDAWKAEDYDAMYALLTGLSQDAISREKFEKHYRGVATEMALSGVDYEIISSLVQNPTSAQVGYRVTFHSTLVGDLQRETVMNLSLEQGQWRVKWDDTLVMPELAGGNYLGMERYIPARANIYDRNGHALVAQADATAIGLIPGRSTPNKKKPCLPGWCA